MDGHVTALFGMPGFEVLSAALVGGEWELLVQTRLELTGCPGCGAVAGVKDRRAVTVRDLPMAGVPVVICWHKRVWECRQSLCEIKSWTEEHPSIGSRAVLTERARQWAFEQVGHADRAVAHVAAELGVGWATIMRQVVERGTPLVEDPERLAGVTAVGVDETAYLRATAKHPTIYATGIVDLSPDRPARLLDVVIDRSGTVLDRWLAERDQEWRDAIDTDDARLNLPRPAR